MGGEQPDSANQELYRDRWMSATHWVIVGFNLRLPRVRLFDGTLSSGWGLGIDVVEWVFRTEASEARHGLPDSNSLTQVDREYFNIIKTEDGVSQFYKYFNSIPKPKSDEMKNNLSISEKHPRFRFHIIKPTDAKSSGSKPIVGIYLANAGN